jgi:hypothetical protein
MLDDAFAVADQCPLGLKSIQVATDLLAVRWGEPPKRASGGAAFLKGACQSWGNRLYGRRSIKLNAKHRDVADVNVGRPAHWRVQVESPATTNFTSVWRNALPFNDPFIGIGPLIRPTHRKRYSRISRGTKTNGLTPIFRTTVEKRLARSNCTVDFFIVTPVGVDWLEAQRR